MAVLASWVCCILVRISQLLHTEISNFRLPLSHFFKIICSELFRAVVRICFKFGTLNLLKPRFLLEVRRGFVLPTAFLGRCHCTSAFQARFGSCLLLFIHQFRFKILVNHIFQTQLLYLHQLKDGELTFAVQSNEFTVAVLSLHINALLRPLSVIFFVGSQQI